ncbi:histidine kinase [Streptomyces sp. 150FB]|uniref:sensor histidine kinase n=1 Tax=Streptomyces sp. 150FB TaxID=1576605 RepID=UPI00058926FC|nr:sensor histidine kinase [Streptomyces sp. 150FB]KIF74338.1 histidine kinase [Streptomyces sp. 150FB]
MQRLRRSSAALLYALIALPLALPGMVLVLSGLLLGAVLSVTALGPWMLALTVRGALALGTAQRALARALLGFEIEPAVRRTAPGALGWRRSVLGDRAGWRAVASALVTPVTAVPAVVAVAIGYAYGLLLTLHPLIKRWNYFTVRAADGSVRRVSLEVGGVQFDTWPRWLLPVAVGLVLLFAAEWLVRMTVVQHRLVLRSLLGPNATDRRIRTLEETRAQAVDEAVARLRRIERDLHDGTQARLVGLGMHLTLIRELIDADAGREEVLTVVETARGSATQAVAELRDLVKGIHPPVLDQGLDTALTTLTAATPLPVTLTADIRERPTPALEAIAYFCAAELLTNAVKHAGAEEAEVEVSVRDGTLRLSVLDDGRGGAVIGAGSGLTGLLARVRTVDGTLSCDSPPGGPTVVDVVLPYR